MRSSRAGAGGVLGGSLIMSALVVAGLFLAPVAQAAPIPAPEPVAAALAGFESDPQAAMSEWAGWVATQPMRYSLNDKPRQFRSICQIDAAGTSLCDDFIRIIGRGGRDMGMKRTSEVITTADRKQYFRDVPLKKWNANKFGANTNPVSNTGRFYSYNPWQPWGTPGIAISTSIGADGYREVRVSNPAPGDDQPSVTVTRVSPDGSKAELIEQTVKGKNLSVNRISIADVATIKIPR
jgi:hypothetical protein